MLFDSRVDVNGIPSVIRGVHMMVCRKSGCNASIWVVPQKYNISFCPLIEGWKLFLLYRKVCHIKQKCFAGKCTDA